MSYKLDKKTKLRHPYKTFFYNYNDIMETYF